MSTPRALVTGDRGFLGRHFKAELRRRGYEVHGLDVKASPAQDCRLFFRECLSKGSVPGLWDLVVHCAAVVGGRATIDGDPLATAESLSIDAEMFRWAAVARPGRVLYFSSSAAYPVAYQTGTWRGETLREDDLWLSRTVGMPDQVYGWTKVTGELLAARLRDSGVPVTVVRPFSGYGEDQDDTYPFRAILGRVLRREDPLEVWGTGEQVRDWIHVDDLVAGALAVAESGTEDPVNLCTGRATSFLDLARMMADVAEYSPEIKPLADKPAGVAYRVGDPARMRRFYEPKVDLMDGILRALNVI
ncbi:NAD-dependent epimerase/dehydratase family protein [Streptomyces sp. NRRL S-455]|uniref:NAD-dependent epimerase/dehydratase family protein n=1 Tax=Streptomyces sp. NRRL S-455 TaxID=1463908 RepID=UPI0004C1A5C0|nr:NAD-dependent epimerase/dehydratase family protein [Streptomyces sp. NRRL S-455]